MGITTIHMHYFHFAHKSDDLTALNDHDSGKKGTVIVAIDG